MSKELSGELLFFTSVFYLKYTYIVHYSVGIGGCMQNQNREGRHVRFELDLPF